MNKRIISQFGILITFVFVSNTAIAAPMFSFNYIQQKLISDGFSKQTIQAMYARPDVKSDFKAISLFFIQQESKLNYDQFLSPELIGKARSYLKEHEKELQVAENNFQVDPKIITAITLVETHLGTVVGNRKVINTLSSIASLGDRHVRDQLWKSISDSTHYSRKKFAKRCKAKSEWAYDELKAFLKFAKQESFDPIEIKGSFAGAMGICQFMPSNALILAKDGNADGKVDLFNHADAIVSIANFLKKYGWHPSISNQDAYEVLLYYNRSKYYVNTLLKIRETL
ncbi:MAG: lytic murein transglycosylase [Desulfobacterales bacterium]|nr:lytic murein transglycosylase [Desulfobacterales bacterium]